MSELPQKNSHNGAIRKDLRPELIEAIRKGAAIDDLARQYGLTPRILIALWNKQVRTDTLAALQEANHVPRKRTPR